MSCCPIAKTPRLFSCCAGRWRTSQILSCPGGQLLNGRFGSIFIFWRWNKLLQFRVFVHKTKFTFPKMVEVQKSQPVVMRTSNLPHPEVQPQSYWPRSLASRTTVDAIPKVCGPHRSERCNDAHGMRPDNMSRQTTERQQQSPQFGYSLTFGRSRHEVVEISLNSPLSITRKTKEN